MSKAELVEKPAPRKSSVPMDAACRAPLRWFAVFAIGLSVLFVKPLIDLGGLALDSSLFSHLPLIPCITAYLIWVRRGQLRETLARSNPKSEIRNPKYWLVPAGLGMATLAFYWFGGRRVGSPELVDSSSPLIFAYVCLLISGGLMILGWAVIRQILFPVLFLFFTVPFPSVLTYGIEMFFQYLSADAAALLFAIARVPVLREGLIFELPGITIQVAEECSGIRSSLVLFITSLLAGYLFLRSPGKRAILALAVIPLGIVRNGFRIFTIAMLCVHVSPDMIHSPIHHRGGPVFFVLSLVPLFILLWWMRRREARSAEIGDRRSQTGDRGGT